MSAWRAAGNARDRTNEFQQLAKRLEQTSQGQASAQNEAAAPLLPPMPKGNPAERSEFARRATRIGMGIHQVAGKLQKLSQLARRTSMFDDPTEEINELTVVVKQDIQTLNGAIGDLQSLATSLKEGHSNKQSQDHSSTVVDSLRTRLKDATMQFKDVLTQRTHSLKDQEGRRQIFSTHKAQGSGGERALPKLTVPGAAGAGGVPSFLQGAVPDVEQGGSADPANSAGGLSAAGGPLMQQAMVQGSDQYLDSRADALRQVESTITELGGIFQQLAHMVAEQGELALRIDENVEDTMANVEGAQGQLLKYLNRVSSNRMLMLKIFGVLMLFVIFFIVFIA